MSKEELKAETRDAERSLRIAFLIGALLICLGVFLINVPAGFITMGVITIVLAVVGLYAIS